MSQTIKTVFCPVDFSSASEEAARYAVELAGMLGAERLDLAYVYQQPSLHLPDGAYFADGSGDELLRANARRQLESLSRRHSQHGLRVTHSLLLGLPTHQAILDHAEEVGADLIVMATTGRSGLGRLLMGSVAEKVVRLSKIPVCTLRAGD